METGLEKIIESISSKKRFALTKEEFKNLRRGIKKLQQHIDENTGIVNGICKWYETWKEQISFPNAAIFQLNEIFAEITKKNKAEQEQYYKRFA